MGGVPDWMEKAKVLPKEEELEEWATEQGNSMENRTRKNS